MYRRDFLKSTSAATFMSSAYLSNISTAKLDPVPKRRLGKTGVDLSIIALGGVAVMNDAQDAAKVGTAFPPDFLLIAVLSMATAWSVASPFAPPLDANAAERPAALRESLIEAVRLLANAGQDSGSRGRGRRPPRTGGRSP